MNSLITTRVTAAREGGRRAHDYRHRGRLHHHGHRGIDDLSRRSGERFRQRARGLHNRQHVGQRLAVDFGAITEGVNILSAGLQQPVGDNAAVGLQSRALRQLRARPEANR